jgi:hypothetical protein
MKKLLLTFLFAAAMISTAMAQKTSKEEKAVIEKALSYAESIAFVYTKFNTNGFSKATLRAALKNSGPLAYIFYIRDESNLDALIEHKEPFVKKRWAPLYTTLLGDDLYGRMSCAIGAGTHVLLVPQKGAIMEKKNGVIEYEIDTLVFNFEEGKHYTINGSIDKDKRIDFSIKETDTAAYSAYQKANPNRLNGTWSGEIKRLATNSSNQYSFNGNRMKFEGDSKYSKQTFAVEGSIMYNENTIIFFPEKAAVKGKEVENFNSRQDRTVYIWYYTLADNELHLENGDPFLVGLKSWENNGVFRKTE